MKPTLYNLLMAGGLSYRDIGYRLGWDRRKVQKFVLLLEKREWISVSRKTLVSLDGKHSYNAVNEYSSSLRRVK